MSWWSELVRDWKSFWRSLRERRNPDPEGYPEPTPPPVTPPAPPPPQPPAPEPPTPPAPAQPPAQPPVEPVWKAVRLECSNAGWRMDPGKAKITRQMRSARREGSNLIRMDYDSIRDWPRHSMEGGKWFSWGGVCVAWLEGDVLVTSWFDHIAKEPQPVKDLKNWTGYVLGGVPSNRQLWIYLLSTDGRQRTNMAALK